MQQDIVNNILKGINFEEEMSRGSHTASVNAAMGVGCDKLRLLCKMLQTG